MGGDELTPGRLAALVDEHGRALVLYARTWCDCPEDVVQEALVELACQRPGPFGRIQQIPQKPGPWLYRVVRNRAISAGRQARRRQRRERQAAASEAWFDRGANQLDAQEATAALAELPTELREVVVARIWGELTFAEIAELVGTSLSTAQRRYEQALTMLQARLEKPCTTEPPTKS